MNAKIDLQAIPLPLLTGDPWLLADPEVSANLYCAGRLCEVICQVVAPSWRDLQAQCTAPESNLWIMRYGKCGEHLKVRWHGPVSRAELWRAILQGNWTSYLAGLSPVEAGAPRLSQSKVTPIDKEDHATADYPDRTLLWTTYERSHVSLGYRPYLLDDVYIAFLTRCLGRSTEILLACLESGRDGRSPHKLRQMILLKALIAGFAALPFSPAERDLYLLYHRDSLLRAFRRRKRLLHGSPNMVKLLARFDAEIERLGGQAKQLATQARIVWQEAYLPPWGRSFEAWGRSLRDLAEYADPLCRDLQHDIDPFAESPLFPALFKAFHGLANQVGLDAFNEAFAYHLLISLTASDDLRQRPVLLRPDL
jgi:Lantibiotic biosynthesis dehydratase C-term